MSDTPRKDHLIKCAPIGIRPIAAFDQAVELVDALELELNAANERIRLLIAERDTARRQADQNYKLREEFLNLLGTDDVEQGVVVVRGLQERIKRLEEAGDAMDPMNDTECECDDRLVLICKYCFDSSTRWFKAKEAKS